MTNIGTPIYKSFNFLEETFYNKPLFETEHFTVIPSLGSLVEGWIMIVPKKHYISFGAIQNPLLYDELNELVKKLGEIIKSIYGDFVLFEHGPIAKETLVGCGVDYAHLHVVPVNINLLEKSKPFLNKEILWSRVLGIDDASEYYRKGIPYLFVRDADESSFIGTSEELPSQLFRKTIAKHIGVEEMYDWKKHPFTDNINKTIQSLLKHRKFFLETQLSYQNE